MSKFESDPRMTAADADDEIEILEIVGLDEPPVEHVVADDAADGDEDLILDFDGEDDDASTGVLDRSLQEERARLVRLQADFENYKKRVEREREADQRQASARLVDRLLPVLDNFERAIQISQGDADPSSFQNGVQLIFRQLIEELRKEGLEAVDTVGEPFDPAVHEAVATAANEDLPHHTIIEEMQRGYTLHGRLLRPALVRVSVLPGQEEPDAAGERHG